MRPIISFIFIAAIFAGGFFTDAQAQWFSDKAKTNANNKTTGNEADAGKPKLSTEELNELTNGYADRYMTYIVSAAQLIEQGNPNAQQRRAIHQVMLTQVSSVYDIVTNADPFTQILDLTLVATLQARKWIDDDEAEKAFGSRGKYLVDASRRAREDIWKIAARVMAPEQLEQLDQMILEWHRKNRDVQVVSYVRFDDFAASRGKSMIADVRSSGGFLSSVDDAKKAVDEVRLLGERAFFMGKRLPFLANWQAKAAINDTLNDPALIELQASVPKIVASVDRVSQVAAQLPATLATERQALFSELNSKQPFISQSLASTQAIVRDTDKLVNSTLKVTQSTGQLLTQLSQTNAELNNTMRAVDQIFLKPAREQEATKDPNVKASKPFDIDQYTKSAVELTNALREANQLLAGTAQLLNSRSLEKPIEVTSAEGTKVIDTAFWRGALLIIIFFVMLGAYRFFTMHVLTRGK